MKKILVTGGNKGIGLAIVKRLLREYPDTYLLLGSRDVQRGEAAVKELVTELGGGYGERLEMVQLDVCSEASVQEAVSKVKSMHGQLFGLINNAGGWLSTPRATIDLNTMAVINVCEAFLPLLEKYGGRIVQVSSASGPSFVAKCSVENQKMMIKNDVCFTEAEEKVIKPYLNIMENSLISDDKKNDALKGYGIHDSAYGVAKACLNVYTMELSRRFPDMKINACTPGFIESDLTRGYLEKSGKTATEMGMKTPEQGATSAVYLMMGDLTGDQTGQYYGSDAVRSPMHKYRSPGDPPFDGSFP